MIQPALFWYACFAVFLAAFACILWRERDARYIFYFVFGSLTAFLVFDLPSTAFGHYDYHVQHYLISLMRVPLSITLAEGFCIAITIYLYEHLPWLWKKLKMG
jgi:hypothetical protein